MREIKSCYDKKKNCGYKRNKIPQFAKKKI